MGEFWVDVFTFPTVRLVCVDLRAGEVDLLIPATVVRVSYGNVSGPNWREVLCHTIVIVNVGKTVVLSSVSAERLLRSLVCLVEGSVGGWFFVLKAHLIEMLKRRFETFASASNPSDYVLHCIILYSSRRNVCFSNRTIDVHTRVCN